MHNTVSALEVSKMSTIPPRKSPSPGTRVVSAVSSSRIPPELTLPCHHLAPPKCHLTSLPRELRDQIWDLALRDREYGASTPYGYVAWIDDRDPKSNLKHSLGISTPLTYKPPTLLATCRLIRDEASSLYYTNTSFAFREPMTCVIWLRSLESSSVDKIRYLRFWHDNSEYSEHGARKAWQALVDFFAFKGIDITTKLHVPDHSGILFLPEDWMKPEDANPLLTANGWNDGLRKDMFA